MYSAKKSLWYHLFSLLLFPGGKQREAIQIPFEIRSLFPKAMSSIVVITVEPHHLSVLSLTSWSRETASLSTAPLLPCILHDIPFSLLVSTSPMQGPLHVIVPGSISKSSQKKHNLLPFSPYSLSHHLISS